MIKNQWYAVLESREINNNKPKGTVRLGLKLVFWRDKTGSLHCIVDRCAHRGAEIHRGDIEENDVRCPFHGLTYDGNGKCTRIPANGIKSEIPANFKVRAFAVKERYGFVWLWWGEGEPSVEIPVMEDIDDNFSYSTFVDHWKVHYSLCIENQLDVSHLPFVHRTTIGKGNKTLVNGPLVEEIPSGFHVYVNNVVDEGEKPLKAQEIDKKKAHGHLSMKFPNLWQNHITEKVRVVAAFSPVDDENSVIYLRFYQKFVRVPLLREFISWIGARFSVIILRQDKRVVETQIPKKSELKMGGQNLFQADYPIIFYRKKREELKKSSN